jgi:hypothetical protein
MDLNFLQEVAANEQEIQIRRTRETTPIDDHVIQEGGPSMSAPTDRLHDPKDLSLEAARWLHAARVAQQTPALVPEPPYAKELPPLPVDSAGDALPAIRRLRAQALKPDSMPEPPLRLRRHSRAAMARRWMMVVALAGLGALVAVGRFPLFEAERAVPGDRRFELASVSAEGVAAQAVLVVQSARETDAAPAALGDERAAPRVPRATEGSVRRELEPDEVASLRQRGKALIDTGDIAAARLVLQRAAEAHDADAALALGATYDPLVLRELRIYGFGFAGDLVLARAWYEKARDYGSPEAMRRLERLAIAQ